MSLAGRMSGRAASGSGPYAWIVGVVLVLTAMVSLQFDRLSVSKISTVAAIEYSLSDTVDDSDDDTLRIATGKALAAAPSDTLSLYSKSWFNHFGSDKAAQPNAPYSRHARGPPLSV